MVKSNFVRANKIISALKGNNTVNLFNKVLLLINILLLSEPCIASICANKSILPDLNADIIIRGCELAFQENHFFDYKFFSANNNTEFIEKVQKITADTSCPIVLGLVSSTRCLIAGPVLVKNKTFGFSATCAHDDIGKFYPYFYTATPPLSKAIDPIIKYLNLIYDRGKIFVIYQPTSIYSKTGFDQFKRKFHQPTIDVPVDRDGQFDVNKFFFRKGDKVTFLFFTYPLPSIKVLVRLSKEQLITKDTRIISNSSWTNEAALLSSVKPILQKAQSVMVVEIIDWEKAQHSAFTKNFIQKFHRKPLNVEIINYDLTKFVIKCYKKAVQHKKYNRDKFQYCITHTKYSGVSGAFSFDQHSSFANRSIYLVNLLERK